MKQLTILPAKEIKRITRNVCRVRKESDRPVHETVRLYMDWVRANNVKTITLYAPWLAGKGKTNRAEAQYVVDAAMPNFRQEDAPTIRYVDLDGNKV